MPCILKWLIGYCTKPGMTPYRMWLFTGYFNPIWRFWYFCFKYSFKIVFYFISIVACVYFRFDYITTIVFSITIVMGLFIGRVVILPFPQIIFEINSTDWLTLSLTLPKNTVAEEKREVAMERVVKTYLVVGQMSGKVEFEKQLSQTRV